MSDKPIEAEIVPIVDSGVVLMPVMNIQAAKQRLAEFQELDVKPNGLSKSAISDLVHVPDEAESVRQRLVRTNAELGEPEEREPQMENYWGAERAI